MSIERYEKDRSSRAPGTRVARTGHNAALECRRIKAAGNRVPRTPQGCEKCLVTGDPWVHLRLCLCGHVGCCDLSQGKHATKHFSAPHHPLMRPLEPGEGWSWYYVAGVFAEW